MFVMSRECKCFLCCRHPTSSCENCILCKSTFQNDFLNDDNDNYHDHIPHDNYCPQIHVQNEYYTPAEFENDVLKHYNQSFLKAYHFNCRSLKSNF